MAGTESTAPSGLSERVTRQRQNLFVRLRPLHFRLKAPRFRTQDHGAGGSLRLELSADLVLKPVPRARSFVPALRGTLIPPHLTFLRLVKA